jgi:hypothetical protein
MWWLRRAFADRSARTVERPPGHGAVVPPSLLEKRPPERGGAHAMFDSCRPRPIIVLAAALVALAAPLRRAAADFIWDGSDDDLWTTGDNWAGGVAPAGAVNDNIVFGAEGGALNNFIVLGADDDYTGITGMSFTGANGAYQISGSGSFGFADGAIILNDSTFLQTINVDLVGTGDNLTISAQSGAFVSSPSPARTPTTARRR